MGIEETARDSAAVFKAILVLKERIEREVLPRFSTRRQEGAHTLMRHLYKRPVIDVKETAGIIGSTTNTASTLINDLVAYGVLQEMTGQRRNRLFMFRDYFVLFER